MLTSINIKNVVLIDNLELDFNNGLSVFTGETGAGKSILLDSLALVLGERAETSLIRHGEKSLQVVAVFDIADNQKIRAFLNDINIELEDNELVLKRIVNNDGKSKAFINETPVTVNTIKKLADFLVEIHGQFMTHGLLDNKTHIDLLDEYGRHDLVKIKSAFERYKAEENEYNKAVLDFEKLKTEEDYLKHNLEELETLKIAEGEYESLEQKIALAAGAEKIFGGLNTAHEALNNSNISLSLKTARNAIEHIEEIAPNKYKNYLETIEHIEIDIKELLMDISSELYNQDISPNSLDEMQERYFNFKTLAKKHGVLPEELYSYIDVLREKVDKINLGSEYVFELKRKVENARLEYETIARNLREQRKKTALLLDNAVMKELPALKLNSAKFKTEVTESSEMRENGLDNVKFRVITNAGGDFEDLSKIASGGELSRFMLALKVNLSGGSDTIIFDEVDAGIGGATANAVGARLKKLGKQKQVLIVTHSPQVASFAMTHFIVKKYEKELKTYTTVTEVKEKDRYEEIARMISGENITDVARNAARQMVKDNERT